MALTTCPECGVYVSENAESCPQCGHPMKPPAAAPPPPAAAARVYRGYEWKSKTTVLGWPLVHIAVGRNRQTGKLMVAKGVIAIGQFGIGLITIAQFGIGILLGFGQVVGGTLAIGQFALGTYFGLGQFATGVTAIGQLALGKYVLAQLGYGKYVWSTRIRDPRAVEYFGNLWDSLKHLFGR